MSRKKRKRSEGPKWTVEDVQAVLFDPTHALTGVVSDDTWVAAQKRLISELGKEAYFQKLWVMLNARFRFAISTLPEEELINKHMADYDRWGADVYFHGLLRHFRSGGIQPDLN